MTYSQKPLTHKPDGTGIKKCERVWTLDKVYLLNGHPVQKCMLIPELI